MGVKRRDLTQGTLLGPGHVVYDRAGGSNCKRKMLTAEAFERGHAEVVEKCLPGPFRIEGVGLKRRDRSPVVREEAVNGAHYH